MTSHEQLQTWRAELVEEKAAMEEQLALARSDLKTAQSTRETAVSAWRDLNDLVAKAMGPLDGGVPGVLLDRLDLARREANQAGNRGAAMARVRCLESQIAGRKLAMRQIDRALSGERPTLVHWIAEKPNRKPQVIDYDNITTREEQTNAR